MRPATDDSVGKNPKRRFPYYVDGRLSSAPGSRAESLSTRYRSLPLNVSNEFRSAVFSFASGPFSGFWVTRATSSSLRSASAARDGPSLATARRRRPGIRVQNCGLSHRIYASVPHSPLKADVCVCQRGLRAQPDARKFTRNSERIRRLRGLLSLQSWRPRRRALPVVSSLSRTFTVQKRNRHT